MELYNSVNELWPWGIDAFDNDYIGLPSRVFNLVRACNKDVSIAAIGHFLQAGIELEQRVTVIGFDHPVYLFTRLNEFGFNFEDVLLSEQLIYLYYKPIFSFSLSYATEYRSLFEEIRALTKGDVSRIAFLNADVLFNQESHLLAESSAERIMASFSNQDCAVIGCYEATNTQAHQHLNEISLTLLSSYIEIKQPSFNDNRIYELLLLKSPAYDTKATISLRLKQGAGFNSANIELLSHG